MAHTAPRTLRLVRALASANHASRLTSVAVSSRPGLVHPGRHLPNNCARDFSFLEKKKKNYINDSFFFLPFALL